MPLRVKLIVAEYQAALLYRDGKYLGLLRPGRYVFWNLGRTYSWVVFDLRGQSVSLAGQEVLTRDRVPVRFTLAANYRVADPAAAQHRVDHWPQQLYLDLQLALRELVADLTFDEVLDQKSAFGESVRAAVAPAAEGYGLELGRVAVKDVTMPATIRDLMLKALEAEKSAQAVLIKAREEVAAARARANAARLLVEAPGGMRLKELETLAEVARSAGNTIVFAPGLDLAGS